MKTKRLHCEVSQTDGVTGDYRSSVLNQNEMLMLRGRMLNRTDRSLLTLLSQGHCRPSQLADLQGISASSVYFHLKRIQKILGREYGTHIRRIESLPAVERKIARLSLINKRSLRTICRLTGQSMYRTRKILSAIKRQTNTQLRRRAAAAKHLSMNND